MEIDLVTSEIDIKQGELWYTAFPFEDDPSRSKDRPAIVLNTKPLCVLSTKVTKHERRSNDTFDIDILDWKQIFSYSCSFIS